MFQYLLCHYLKDNRECKVFGFYREKDMSEHNGLELTNAFINIKLPKQSLLTLIIVLIYKIVNKISGKNKIVRKDFFNIKNIIFDGYWQDKMFFDEKTVDLFEFNKNIGILNESYLEQINKYNSISVHIRRGDYMNNISIYGNICTKDYYERAIEYFKNKYENNLFVFFSDDIEWVKANFELKNAIYVDNNKEKRSYIDMYLMSKCNHNIIANSTFSWWGAYLNRNKNKTVIMPSKWYNEDINTFNLFIDNWIKL